VLIEVSVNACIRAFASVLCFGKGKKFQFDPDA
jgi:hypothetical protein